jgi:hypothetical protein
MGSKALIVAALWAVAVAPSASAQEYSSQYSSTMVKKCKVVDRAPKDEGSWTIWQCTGVGGYVVRITEDDLRHNVSMGRTFKEAADAAVARHQFPTFNAIGDTLEWRMFKGRPFATIHRWTLFDAAGAGKPAPYSMMVVTRLNPTCHASYVDVRANAPANANDLARRAADTHATIFDCNNPPIVIGQRGRAIELSRP